MRRLLASTIWAPGLFGLPPDRYANIYRIVLPVFDAVLIIVGFCCMRVGVPAFRDYTGSETVAHVWGVALVIVASACLLGIIFPTLFMLEVLGKIGVSAILGVYVGALLFLSAAGDDTRSVVAGMSTGGLLLALWRLGDLRTERRLRLREKKRAAQ